MSDITRCPPLSDITRPVYYGALNCSGLRPSLHPLRRCTPGFARSKCFAFGHLASLGFRWVTLLVAPPLSDITRPVFDPDAQRLRASPFAPSPSGMHTGLRPVKMLRILTPRFALLQYTFWNYCWTTLYVRQPSAFVESVEKIAILSIFENFWRCPDFGHYCPVFVRKVSGVMLRPSIN